ncbi:hypothetical protein CHS0354_006593 [Potamilus streckersoni]|uniref:Uncharacterized protein n=1 Tax=Potamilus streckersoni TaxID=2493646 RepID=A0AAE0SWY0_9BIVA|nr:hypothetical protein CHS0354_006593 [Potamilus streckersoni]
MVRLSKSNHPAFDLILSNTSNIGRHRFISPVFGIETHKQEFDCQIKSRPWSEHQRSSQSRRIYYKYNISPECTKVSDPETDKLVTTALASRTLSTMNIATLREGFLALAAMGGRRCRISIGHTLDHFSRMKLLTSANTLPHEQDLVNKAGRKKGPIHSGPCGVRLPCFLKSLESSRLL